MSDDKNELKDYAGGWITERKGTDAPGFLKLAIPVIGLGCTAYLFLQIFGDTEHATRGSLVQEFNKVSNGNSTLSYAVGVLALIYVLIVVAFAIRKFHED